MNALVAKNTMGNWYYPLDINHDNTFDSLPREAVIKFKVAVLDIGTDDEGYLVVGTPDESDPRECLEVTLRISDHTVILEGVHPSHSMVGMNNLVLVIVSILSKSQIMITPLLRAYIGYAVDMFYASQSATSTIKP